VNEQHLAAEQRIIATFLGLHARTAGVEGFLRPTEGYMLARLASSPTVQGEVVEIGSFKGLSTLWLAMGLKIANLPGKVHAVDHFKGSPEHQPGQRFADKDVAAGGTLEAFRRNIAERGLADTVETIAAGSADAARQWSARGGKPVRLLFIDGDHAYDATKQDFDLWSPFVAPGGLVAFHDYGAWDGVTKFVDELARAKGTYTPFLGVDSMRVFKRA
jgi:predicted O-methyltransferase YrrM